MCRRHCVKRQRCAAICFVSHFPCIGIETGNEIKDEETTEKRTGNEAPFSLCRYGNEPETSGKPSKPRWKRTTAKSRFLVSILCGFHKRILPPVFLQPTLTNGFGRPF